MLKDIAATLLAAAQARLALLVNEVQVEKHLLLRQIILILALAFCSGMVVLLLVGLALVQWWDARLLVLTLAAVLFLALAAWFYAMLQRAARRVPPVLSVSLDELQEDLRQLREASNAEKPR